MVTSEDRDVRLIAERHAQGNTVRLLVLAVLAGLGVYYALPFRKQAASVSLDLVGLLLIALSFSQTIVVLRLRRLAAWIHAQPGPAEAAGAAGAPPATPAKA